MHAVCLWCAVVLYAAQTLDFDHGRGLEKNKGIACVTPRARSLMINAIEAMGSQPA